MPSIRKSPDSDLSIGRTWRPIATETVECRKLQFVLAESITCKRQALYLPRDIKTAYRSEKKLRDWQDYLANHITATQNGIIAVNPGAHSPRRDFLFDMYECNDTMQVESGWAK